MTLSAPSPSSSASRILTHRASATPFSRSRGRDVLAALVDRPMPVLAHYLGRTVVAADPVETIGPGEVWDALADHGGRRDGDPLAGALIGLLGYDLAGDIERLPAPRDTDGPPAAALGRFDTVAVEEPDGSWRIASCGSRSRAAELERIVARAAAPARAPVSAGEPTASLPPEAHRRAVARARELIRAGDCYQVNLATRLRAATSAEPLQLALALWDAAGPARHAAFLGLPGGAVISASPERLLAVLDGVALTEPIKGTAPLGAPPQELLSEKNRAEHVMIVDLMRNDLGRVARRGGVRVEALLTRRPTPYVDHLVSDVRAELRADVSTAEIIRAVLPGGSVTGAPKVRAMEVIHELEPVGRGPAYGSVAVVGADGSLDASVTIRTAWLAAGRVDYWTGGAIVWDSDAEAEHAEAMLKAAPFFEALAP